MNEIARTGAASEKNKRRARLAARLADAWEPGDVAGFLNRVLADPNAAHRWLIAQIPRLDPAYVNTGTNRHGKAGTVNIYAIERDYGFKWDTVNRAVKENHPGGTGIDHTQEETP